MRYLTLAATPVGVFRVRFPGQPTHLLYSRHQASAGLTPTVFLLEAINVIKETYLGAA